MVHQAVHLGMPDHPICVVEQKRQPGLSKPLLAEHLFQAVEQQIARHDATAALLKSRSQRVAGLAGCIEDIRTGQERRFVLEGVDVPRPLSRIVTGRTGSFRHLDEVLGQKHRNGLERRIAGPGDDDDAISGILVDMQA